MAFFSRSANLSDGGKGYSQVCRRRPAQLLQQRCPGFLMPEGCLIGVHPDHVCASVPQSRQKAGYL